MAFSYLLTDKTAPSTQSCLAFKDHDFGIVSKLINMPGGYLRSQMLTQLFQEPNI